ncbi:MAG: spondin domain-containing protein [Acidiferrobacterales bacterium]|nr:spondin domain-containing protein [Acidiferrobacterales bacterium]
MFKVRKIVCQIAFTLVLSAGCIGNVVADSNRATYKVEIAIDWSKATAPFEHPGDPHMSSMIGLTHGERFSLFADGDTASSGLELLAENGRFGILRAQFEELERRDRIGAVVEAGGIKSLPGQVSTTFKTTKNHPLLSVVTMLAPSPDWFTGISAVNLLDGGKWIDTLSLPLWVWDAGTDSGSTFKSKNIDTQPRESIRLLATKHFLNDAGLIRIGTISIARQR